MLHAICISAVAVSGERVVVRRPLVFIIIFIIIIIIIVQQISYLVVNFIKASYFTAHFYCTTLQAARMIPASILHKSIAGRYRSVRVADGPITARYRFM